MQTTLFLAAGVMAAAGMASAMPAGAAHAATRPEVRAATGAGDPSTGITFTVTTGALSITVPTNADLGSGAPGDKLSAPIGPCTVTDARALTSASWTVTAAETNFASGAQTIAATDAAYAVGVVTTTGVITVTPHEITLANTAQTVLDGRAGNGSNTASWTPAVTVTVPAGAVTGTYSGTLTQSVS